MNRLAYLRPILSKKKTLVITCHECSFGLEELFRNQVFTYSSLGNILQQHDHLQEQSIRYYIEEKQCTQILVAGHTHCAIIKHILRDRSGNSYVASLKGSLEELLANNHSYAFRDDLREKMLVEQNVIEQCKLLMEYTFVQSRIEQGALNLIGLVSDESLGNIREIFHNRIIFNDLISLN